MKPIALSTILCILGFTVTAQNISVTFSGTGAATSIDSVKATNLKTNQSVTLPGNETLILSVNSGISTVTDLTDMGIVYPNPFSDRTTFTTLVSKPQQVHLTLMNLFGQVVAQSDVFVQQGENQFEISIAVVGIYMVSIKTDQGTASYKILCTNATTSDSSIHYVGTINGPDKYPMSFGLKNAMTSYSLGYTVGDVILYRCRSGIYTTVVTDTLPASKNYEVEFAPCTDADGRNYAIVKIGDQTWMAENMAYLPSVSPSSDGSLTDKLYYVYNYFGTSIIEAKNSDHYKTYGVLYNWPAAMNGDSNSNSVPSGVQGVCPKGWHIPSDAEWTILSDHLGSDAGTKMKASSYWVGSKNGNNSSGFTALPAGYRFYTGGNSNLGAITFFWSSFGNNGSHAWCEVLDFNTVDLKHILRYRSSGYSVRCLKN